MSIHAELNTRRPAVEFSSKWTTKVGRCLSLLQIFQTFASSKVLHIFERAILDHLPWAAEVGHLGLDGPFRSPRECLATPTRKYTYIQTDSTKRRNENCFKCIGETTSMSEKNGN